MNWREIKVLVRQAPPGSAVFRTTFGEQATWSITDHLMASAVDVLNLLAWLQSKDGQRNVNRPKPIKRPGGPKTIGDASVDQDGALQLSRGEEITAGTAMTIDEFNTLWARASGN